MERESGDSNDNRRRQRRGAFGYRFRLFNFLMLGQWAYLIFARMRNVVQAHRRRLVRRRWGIRLTRTGKPNRRTCNPHQQGDSSSGFHDEFEGASGTVASEISVVTVHQGIVPTEGKPNIIDPSEPVAGPSGIKKISSKEDTSTDLTEAESKEATNIQEQPTQPPHTIPLPDDSEGTSDDSDDDTAIRTHHGFSYFTQQIPISPRSRSPLDSEDLSDDEEMGATIKSTHKKNTTE